MPTFTPAVRAKKVARVQTLLARGIDVYPACKKIRIAPKSYYIWSEDTTKSAPNSKQKLVARSETAAIYTPTLTRAALASKLIDLARQLLDETA